MLAHDELPNPNVVFGELEDVPRTRGRESVLMNGKPISMRPVQGRMEA